MSDQQTAEAPAPKYPEHAKLKALAGKNEVVAAFLEWCGSEGIELCVYRESGDNGEPKKIRVPEEEYKANIFSSHYNFGGYDEAGNSTYVRDNPARETWGEGHVPVYWVKPQMKGIEGILAAYFGIDLAKLETEKVQMIEDFRAAQGIN